jgi:crotonobetainyl-CoA:carnitine CoA-transferase CaiB-like acyl-CoA transferase
MLDSVSADLLPMDGVTVVALEHAVAGPLATRNLADLGARVIKIERVGEGDFARQYDATVNGLGSHFVWLNRGKESLALDLKSAEGRHIATRLLARADVFVQNAAPGAADRLGLGAAQLIERNPSLVIASISGYGTSGPLRDRKAYDMLIQAESGLVSVTGTPETATKTGIPTADIAAGMYACNAVLAALLRRGRTGRGGIIDVSMLDATVEWLGHPMYVQMYAGRQVPRMRLGHAAIAPYDAYPTSDGEVLIGVQNDRGWQALVADVFGRPELGQDRRFATNPLRVANRHECDATVAECTRRFTTVDLVERLTAAGVPSAQVNDMGGLIAHPQLADRDRWRDVTTPNGVVRGLLPPATFHDVELGMGPVPDVGAHTSAILAELGLGESDIDRLVRAGLAGRPSSLRSPRLGDQRPNERSHDAARR